MLDEKVLAAEEELKKKRRELEDAKKEAARVRAKLVASETVDASGCRRLFSQDEELQQAEAKVREKWEAHQKAFKAFNDVARRSFIRRH